MNRKLLALQILTWATVVAALCSAALLMSGEGIELATDFGFGARSVVVR